MQLSLPYEGKTFNTDSEHNHFLVSETYKTHIILCGGETAAVFNITAGGTYSTVCTLQGSNPLLPDLNNLCKIL